MLLTNAKVADADPGVDLSGSDLDDTAWLDIAVPGDLHAALVEAGRIPDPNVGGAADACAWVEDREWWWRIRFTADEVTVGERIELLAQGLDTFVTAYLNGVEIGRHRNMFRPATWEVTDSLQNDNVLALCFHRPLASVDRSADEDARLSIARMRKAQLGYGWDFAPRRPTIGPWLPIELVRISGPRLEAVHVRTASLSADHQSAELAITVEVNDSRPLTADLAVTGPDGTTVASASVSVTGRAEAGLRIEHPALWWSHDRGRPDLHRLTVTLRDDADELDRHEQQFGVRTIELPREPDDFGRSFTFVLNGEPFAATGANWVPADLSLANPDPVRYEGLITAARDANMNMLRIWGGGIYEHDLFYDLCDRLGILVWQDFMFACSPAYDDTDPEWLAEIEAEARYQVRRLRSHASLALWCGNNEVAMIAELVIGPGTRPGERIFAEVLPKVVETEDGFTSYLATTPLVGPTNEVDRHCWKVWHGIDETRPESYTHPASMANDGTPVDPASQDAVRFVEQAGPHGYLTDRSRFTSEYGLASASDLQTVQHWTDPAHQVLGDPHITSRLSPATRGPANKFDLLTSAVAGEPHDLVEFCDLTQLAHAEGLKVGMEHYRRGWPRCGGNLIWMLNDCWPASSWSLIDFDLRRKAAFYYAQRAFAPVLASFAPTDDGVSLWLTNTSRDAVADDVAVRRLRFDGTVEWETTLAVSAAASTSSSVLELPDEALADPMTSYLEVRSASGAIGSNRHFQVPVRDLQRSVVTPTFTVQRDGAQTAVTLTATDLCLVTHLVVAGEVVEWSDDFFDLAASETRTVTATGSFDIAGLTVRCY